MPKGNQINANEVIYVFIVLVLAFMAVASVAVYTSLGAAQRQRESDATQPAIYNQINLKLPQNDWLKQSELKAIRLLINGAAEENLSALWEFSGKSYVRLSMLENRYQLNVTRSKSDDLIYFKLKGKLIYLRLGATQMLYDNQLLSFVGAPEEYNGEIYLPNSMVEFIEEEMGTLYSWAVSDDKAYVNYFAHDSAFDIYKITRQDRALSILGLLNKKSAMKVWTAEETPIRSITPCHVPEKLLLFVQGGNKNFLLSKEEIVVESLVVTRIFPAQSKINQDGTIVFWQDDAFLQIYDIMNDKKNRILKKDFQTGFLESVFGIGEVTLTDAKFTDASHYYVDFKASNGTDTCIFRNGESAKILSNLISSPDRSRYIIKTGSYYEVFEKSSELRKAVFYASETPIWMSDNILVFRYNGKNETIDLSTGLQKDIGETNQVADNLFRAGLKTKATATFFVTGLQNGNEATIDFSSNRKIPNRMNSFRLLIDTNSADFSVSQRGKNKLILRDATHCWIINTNTSEVYCATLNQGEVGFLF